MVNSDARASEIRANDVLLVTMDADAPLPGPGPAPAPAPLPPLPPREPVRIPAAQLVIGECLQDGFFSVVSKGKWRSATDVVIKRLRGGAAPGAAAAQAAELAALTTLVHPRVCLLLGVCDDLPGQAAGPSCALVMEFMERGSLYRRLHESPELPALPLEDKLRVMIDVADGMRFLHSGGLVHRDLKSANVLIDRGGRAKITDFGLSKFKQDTASKVTGAVGTPAWTSPEAMRGDPIRDSTDVYSFGVVLWETWTRQLPWDGLDPMQIMMQVGLQNKRLEVPEASPSLPATVAELMRTCFGDAAARPAFHDAYMSLQAALLQQRSRSISSAFLCPLTYDILADPVICADGTTYERAAIQQWLAVSSRSPLTNEELPSRVLVSNRALKQAVEGFRQDPDAAVWRWEGGL